MSTYFIGKKIFRIDTTTHQVTRTALRGSQISDKSDTNGITPVGGTDIA